MAELKEEEAVVANGVGPPEEKGPYVVNEVKDDEKGKGESEQEKEKEDDVGAEIEEEKGTEEKGIEEEKNKEENVAGTEMEEDVGKEDKITEDVGTTKDTDMKIEEAEDAKEEDKAPKEDAEEEKKVEEIEEEAVDEDEHSDDVDMKVDESEEVKTPKEKRKMGRKPGMNGDKEKKDKSPKEDAEEEKVEEIEEEAVDEDEHSDDANMKVDESEEVKTPKEKRKRGRKPGMNGDKKEKKGSGTKEKESPRTTSSSTIDRPVRERRTVERLVEVIEEGTSRGFLIEKGRGTPLKDIPNVAYKLARRRPADLKLLHQTLFGRRGKALNYRTHILQFSGFPWPEDDEKQRAKVKEKLDKFVKDMLVDFCDLFDIPVSKTGTKKEDLVVKLLDFMMAPHATTDVILAEKDQSSKSRKRKRIAKSSGSKNAGTSGKTSRKKQNRGEGSASTKCRDAQETEDDYGDEEDNESVSDEDKTHAHSASEENEDESEEEAEGDEDDDEDPRKSKQDKKTPPKQRSSGTKEKIKAEVTRKVPRTAAKSPPKSLSSKHSVEETNDAGEKVFSRRKKTADVPEEKLSPKAVKKERSAGKRVPAGKGKSEDKKPSGPSKDELRKTICEILKEVDFNTATFTDILKKLAEHYKMDLTPRKLAIKLMIQKELTKLAEEAEENEEGGEEDTDKGGNSKASGNKLEA